MQRNSLSSSEGTCHSSIKGWNERLSPGSWSTRARRCGRACVGSWAGGSMSPSRTRRTGRPSTWRPNCAWCSCRTRRPSRRRPSLATALECTPSTTRTASSAQVRHAGDSHAHITLICFIHSHINAPGQINVSSLRSPQWTRRDRRSTDVDLLLPGLMLW